jgi:hypothetical protein
MRLPVALLALSLVGCGSPGGASERGNEVAQKFQAACLKEPTSSPKAAQVTRKLCSCVAKELRSTVRPGDTDGLVESKIEVARRVCLKKAYPHGI